MRLLSNGPAIEILNSKIGDNLKDECDVKNPKIKPKDIRSDSILNTGLNKKDIKRLDQKIDQN